MIRKFLVALVSWCVVTGAVALEGTETVAGRARVLDGDTIEIAERRIRLYGIVAKFAFGALMDVGQSVLAWKAPVASAVERRLRPVRARGGAHASFIARFML